MWYKGMVIQLRGFLNLALDGGKWLASRPGCFTPGERAPVYPFERRLSGPPNPLGKKSASAHGNSFSENFLDKIFLVHNKYPYTIQRLYIE
jgi:hypothetical protein